ncbi:MAG TPA: hypothetical protein VJX74_15055, partial [Blastocatellia bacterium]|nr:hypothetical protein [Blastocatellia bacterium]
MNRAKRSLLLAISLSVFMSLVVVQSLPAQTKLIHTTSPGLMDETLPLDDDARWDDGFGFSTVNQLPFIMVRAIAVNSSGLYVGGSTMFFFDLPVINGIARWDGNSWSDVGGGVELCPSICYGAVYALEAKGDDIYAGGSFINAGGVRANFIARWDGSKWSALGNGISIITSSNDYVGVNAIALSGNNVYTVGNPITDVGGGRFLHLDGFVRWDGSNWSTVGGGITGSANTASLNAIAIKDG